MAVFKFNPSKESEKVEQVPVTTLKPKKKITGKTSKKDALKKKVNKK